MHAAQAARRVAQSQRWMCLRHKSSWQARRKQLNIAQQLLAGAWQFNALAWRTGAGRAGMNISPYKQARLAARAVAAQHCFIGVFAGTPAAVA